MEQIWNTKEHQLELLRAFVSYAEGGVFKSNATTVLIKTLKWLVIIIVPKDQSVWHAKEPSLLNGTHM